MNSRYVVGVFLLCALLSLTTKGTCKECAAVRLDVGQFIDQSCHLFRMIRKDGQVTIVKEKGDKIVAREIIDCKRAVLDRDGTYEYKSHLANAHFYCPRRELGTIKKYLYERQP